jgi:hypothetical protein
MFGDKYLIKYLYHFGVKFNVYVSNEKEGYTSKLFLKRIKYYNVGYIESIKIVLHYEPHKHQLFSL